jgi:flagellar hook assembly protein FlgD
MRRLSALVSVLAFIFGGLCAFVAPASADAGTVSVLTPTADEDTGQSLTLTASAPGGSTIAYVVDGDNFGNGTVAGESSTAPYTVSWTDQDVGLHSVVAMVCQTGETAPNCTGAQSAATLFTINAMSPRLVSVTRAFDPRTTGLEDNAAVDYVLDVASLPTLTVLGSNGQIRAIVQIAGTQSAGEHHGSWNGRTSGGDLLAAGTYTVFLTTGRVLSDPTEIGVSAGETTRIELYGPTVSRPHSDGRLFVVKDGYRDEVQLQAHVSAASVVSFTILGKQGHAIRVLQTRMFGAGTAAVTWNGSTTAGPLAKPGRYRLSVSAVDALGARSAAASGSTVVDGRQLVMRKTSRQVSPTGSQVSTLSNSCNVVTNMAAGLIDLYSEDGCSEQYNVAATDNEFELPAAIRYGHITLSVTGENLTTRRAYLTFTSPDWLQDYGDRLSKAGTATSSSRTIPVSRVSSDVHFTVAAIDGDHYTVHGLTLRWSYYALVGRAL